MQIDVQAKKSQLAFPLLTTTFGEMTVLQLCAGPKPDVCFVTWYLKTLKEGKRLGQL
jgi:hypothetical protein